MREFIIKCDTCSCESHVVNTENEIVAQRILVEHHKWKVYKTTEGLPQGQLWEWKRACPECTRLYAIRKSRERKSKDPL